MRYVLHPSEDSVSLYFLDRRIDLRAEAVPLVKAMLKRREFSARTAMQLLGQGFEWKDVKPALQELVNAGALHVAQQSEKKNALRTPQ